MWCEDGVQLPVARAIIVALVGDLTEYPAKRA